MNILYVRIILVAAIITVAAYMLIPKPPTVSPCNGGYEPSQPAGSDFICVAPEVPFECAGSISFSKGFSICGRLIENTASIPGVEYSRLEELAASNDVVLVRGKSSEWYRPCPDPPGYAGAAVCGWVYKGVEVDELIVKAQ